MKLQQVHILRQKFLWQYFESKYSHIIFKLMWGVDDWSKQNNQNFSQSFLINALKSAVLYRQLLPFLSCLFFYQSALITYLTQKMWYFYWIVLFKHIEGFIFTLNCQIILGTLTGLKTFWCYKLHVLQYKFGGGKIYF